jgi:hypothetical protein
VEEAINWEVMKAEKEVFLTMMVVVVSLVWAVMEEEEDCLLEKDSYNYFVPNLNFRDLEVVVNNH